MSPLVLKIAVMGVEACGGNLFDVGAGEVWDGFVEMMMRLGVVVLNEFEIWKYNHR